MLAVQGNIAVIATLKNRIIKQSASSATYRRHASVLMFLRKIVRTIGGTGTTRSTALQENRVFVRMGNRRAAPNPNVPS